MPTRASTLEDFGGFSEVSTSDNEASDVVRVLNSLNSGDIVVFVSKIYYGESPLFGLVRKAEGGALEVYRDGFFGDPDGIRFFKAENIDRIELIARANTLASAAVTGLILRESLNEERFERIKQRILQKQSELADLIS